MLVGAIGIGGLSRRRPPRDATEARLAAQTVTRCTVTDGDTLRCGSEWIRLLGIDALELPGHCRSGSGTGSVACATITNSLAAARLRMPLHRTLPEVGGCSIVSQPSC